MTAPSESVGNNDNAADRVSRCHRADDGLRAEESVGEDSVIVDTVTERDELLIVDGQDL